MISFHTKQTTYHTTHKLRGTSLAPLSRLDMWEMRRKSEPAPPLVSHTLHLNTLPISPPFRFLLLLSLFSLPVSFPPLLIALTQRQNMLLTVTAAAFSLAAPTISDRCSRVRTADPFQ